MAWRARRLFLATLGMLLAFAAITATLLVRAPVSATLAQWMVPGLSIDGAEGSLLSGLFIRRIHYENGKLRLEIESLRVEVQSAGIAPPRLDLSALRVRKLTVTELARSDAPAVLPGALVTPLPISVQAMSIAEFVWQPLGATDKADPVIVRDIEARFTVDANAIRIDNLSAMHAGIRTRTRADLAATPPFTLDADVSATGSTGGHTWQAALKASGTLRLLRASATMHATGDGPAAIVAASARIEPFQPQPITRAEFRIADLDLHAWQPDAPVTRLSGQAVLQPDATGYAGSLYLHNAGAGTLDTQRLPIQSLGGHLQLDRDGNARLANIRVEAGKAGSLTGNGQWTAATGTLALALELAGVDLRRWHASLVRTSLQGPIALNLGTREQRMRLAVKDAQLALQGDLTRAAGTTRGQLTLAGTRLGEARGHFEFQAQTKVKTKVEAEAEVQAGAGAALAGTPTFSASGTLTKVNLAALGRFPPSELNGRFALSATVRPQQDIALQLDLADSTLAGRPFTAKSDLRLRGKVLERGDLTANLAGNQLTARGAFGAPGATLQWAIEAPNLTTLGSAFAGEVRGSGTLTGTADLPALDAMLKGTRIKLPGDTTLADLDLTARIATDRDAPLNVTANIRRLRVDHRELIEHLSIKVDGTRAAHAASLKAVNAKWMMEAATRGGFGDYWSWAGELATFTARGPVNARLQQPARLLIGSERQRIDHAVFDVGGGELVIETLDRTPATIDSRGTLARFPVTALFPLMDPSVTDLFTSTLRLKGGWDVNWVDLPSARANIQREDGDLTLKSTPPFAFGLNQLALVVESAVDSTNPRVRMAFNGTGSAAGKIALDLALPITARAGNLEIDRSTSLSGNADVQLPSLRWIGPWLGPAHDVDGLFTASLKLTGAWPHVRPAGRIAGANIRYTHLTEGIAFRDGELAASIADHVITLDQFTLKGGDGVFDAVGRLELDESNPTGGIDWRADKLHLLNLVDRSVVASGHGNIALKNRQLSLTGQLRADSGRIVLPESSAPTLSEDVVVLGRERANGKLTAQRPLALDLGLNLGNDFMLSGRGLDVRLGGHLQLTASPENPLTTIGTLRARAGTYRAYGQDLNIERAVVGFNGRIDNPSLDILALRQGSPVSVGAAISGTAEKPVLRLVSNPEMPDGEKLSWLVLGRGSNGMDPSDKGAMQAAARTLLAHGAAASLVGTLTSTFGVDAIGLGTSSASTASVGTDPGMVVTVGKRLSSRASIVYEQGLNGADALIRLSYQLSRRWRVQLVTGSENAVDFFYRLAFD